MDTASGIVAVVLGGGALVGIITPILRLNSSIVELTAKIDKLIDDMNRNENRITKHGEEIDRIDQKVTELDFRVGSLEKVQSKCGQG